MPSTKQKNTCADAAVSVLRAPAPGEQRQGVFTRIDSPPYSMREDIDGAAGGSVSGGLCHLGASVSVTRARVRRRQVTVWREDPVATPDCGGGHGAHALLVPRQTKAVKRRHGTRPQVRPQPGC